MNRLFSLMLCAGLAQAHEIGTTRVAVTLHEGRTFDIEIATDGTALAEKLVSVTGRDLPQNTPVPELQRIIATSEALFRKRVKVAFDDAEVTPEFSASVTPAPDAASAPAAIIHLKGQIPEGARNLTWKFGWTFASYALTMRAAAGDSPATQWLEGGQTSAPFSLNAIPPSAGGWKTAWRYLTLGFTHIMPNGIDHMLFVLGIYLLSTRPRNVLLQVSAFTIAHSITLGLSLYGLVNVPSRIVEPLIALSIAYVAIENIFLSELKSWRVALVFCFGLLHGMGFAGALKELGLPRSEFVMALLTFNIGVEAGQLAVIAVAFLLVGWHWSNRAWYRGRVVVPASAMIACMAIYWTVERLWA